MRRWFEKGYHLEVSTLESEDQIVELLAVAWESEDTFRFEGVIVQKDCLEKVEEDLRHCLRVAVWIDKFDLREIIVF